MMTTQNPESASVLNVFISFSEDTLSRFANGSSKITIFCPIAIVAAVINVCFCPPDKVFVLLFLSIPNNSVTISICSLIFCTGNAKFSQPNAISSSAYVCIICSSAF